MGHAGFRMKIKGAQKDFTVYIDPNLSNHQMPSNLRREIERNVVPSDANLILITHSHYQHMASALPLALAAEDPDCRIACCPEVAAQFRGTNMIAASKLIVLNIGGSLDLGYARITMVQAQHCTGKAQTTKDANDDSNEQDKENDLSPNNNAALATTHKSHGAGTSTCYCTTT